MQWNSYNQIRRVLTVLMKKILILTDQTITLATQADVCEGYFKGFSAGVPSPQYK